MNSGVAAILGFTFATPIWLHHDGTVQRLSATATVVGLFERWEGSVAQITLGPGDLLAVFSDGITEATHDQEEYGEARLIEEMRAHPDLAQDALIEAVLADVQRFSTGPQADDLTLLIVRALG